MNRGASHMKYPVWKSLKTSKYKVVADGPSIVRCREHQHVCHVREHVSHERHQTRFMNCLIGNLRHELDGNDAGCLWEDIHR